MAWIKLTRFYPGTGTTEDVPVWLNTDAPTFMQEGVDGTAIWLGHDEHIVVRQSADEIVDLIREEED
jgi:hypothetical protein